MKNFINRKIFYLFPGGDGFIHNWQQWHFIDELKRQNIDIEIFNPNAIVHYEEIVLDKLRSNRDDYCLLMTAMTDRELRDSFLIELKSIGIPSLLICWDNLIIPYFHKRISKFFDLVWLFSKENIHKFKEWGANPIFMPYAANPYLFHPVSNGEPINKLLFIGSPHGGRGALIQHIALLKHEVDVFGNWSNIDNNSSFQVKDFYRIFDKFFNYLQFKEGRACLISSLRKRIGLINPEKKYIVGLSCDELRINGLIDFNEMVKAYSDYAVSLSIIEYLDTYLLNSPIYKLHLRTFEIPMSGGVQLTKNVPELSNYFEPQKEILLYNSMDELSDLLSFYTRPENEKLRNVIKANARKRCVQDHTWSNRFKSIHDVL